MAVEMNQVAANTKERISMLRQVGASTDGSASTAGDAGATAGSDAAAAFGSSALSGRPMSKCSAAHVKQTLRQP